METDWLPGKINGGGARFGVTERWLRTGDDMGDMSFSGDGSVACLANFLKAAAKLEVRVAFRAGLLLMEVTMLLLGETWFNGGTVAVVLVIDF